MRWSRIFETRQDKHTSVIKVQKDTHRDSSLLAPHALDSLQHNSKLASPITIQTLGLEAKINKQHRATNFHSHRRDASHLDCRPSRHGHAISHHIHDRRNLHVYFLPVDLFLLHPRRTPPSLLQVVYRSISRAVAGKNEKGEEGMEEGS
jgi:hypothetical protein